MGVYSKLNRPIVVVEYDPQWPDMFEHEKEAIMVALGNWVLLIEHIGSTAVPGLAAKPVIDIGVGIRSLMDAHDLIPRIESLKYIYEPTLEQLVPERRFFWKGTPVIHTYHLHLAEANDPVLLSPIRFRDYLREHPDTAKEYGALKKKLAKRCKQDITAYVAGKTALVERVLKQAEQDSANASAA